MQDSFLFPIQPSQNVDKETNTECVFIQPPLIGRKWTNEETRLAAASTVVKRSKTFSPSAPISKSQYNCRVSSVSDPDPIGSGFKLPCWIRIRNPDPESEIEL